MSLDLPLPLWLLELDLSPDLQAAGILLRPDTLWMGSNAETLGSRLLEHLQDKKLDEGVVLDALLLAPEVDEVQSERVAVLLPGRKGASPPIRLSYLAAFGRLGARWFGVAPVLGVTVVTPDLDAARRTLISRISAGLNFEKLAADPRDLLVTQVGETLRVRRHDGLAQARTAAEVRAIAEGRNKKPRLPQIARRRRVVKQDCFKMEAPLAALRRATRGRSSRGVLLVGPHGVGKSTLLDELIRGGEGQIHGADVWEVAPGQLLLDLMGGGAGWQQPLAEAVSELRTSGAWLRVTRLAELFEVGRYEGNDTSIAEYLRTPLHRGELRLLSEATAEEVARIEARYPGWLDGLHRIVVAEPADLVALARAWAEARGPGWLTDEALVELIRLQRRFTPHAGFPGRTLHVLGGLQRAAAATGAVVDREAVYQRFCEETGLYRALIDPQLPLPLDGLRAFFEARIYGQPEAVAAVVALVATMKADVARHGKPLASLLLVGPTGVGKTETAKAISELLFGSRDRMIRFDMSEYATPWAVSRLVGGLDGTEGKLTGAIRREPFSVLLFDEVEKAHPAFLDLLLQVLGEGRLSDDSGRVADFNASVVLLTSNIGAAEAARPPSGFVGEGLVARQAGAYERAVSGWLRPELKNRLDRVLTYAPLPQAAVRRVLDRELAALARRPGMAGVTLALSEAARDHLAAQGYHPSWGGRQMIRAIEEGLTGPLALERARWGRPGAPLMTVERSRGGLDVVASPNPNPLREPEETAYNAAFSLCQDVRRVLDSRAFASLDALAQPRRRGRQGETTPGPEQALVAELRALEPEALDALMRAAEEGVDPSPPARLLRWPEGPEGGASPPDLRPRLAQGLRALHHRLHPCDSYAVLAIYGRDPAALATWRDHTLAVCEQLQTQALVCALHAADGGGVVLLEPGVRPKSPVGDLVGYELFLDGPAIAPLLRDEARLIALSRPRGEAIRLRVVLAQIQTSGAPSAATALSRELWAKLRPEDIQRKAFYEGRPTREIREGRLRDLTAGGKVELELPQPWDRHLQAHLRSQVIPTLLARCG